LLAIALSAELLLLSEVVVVVPSLHEIIKHINVIAAAVKRNFFILFRV
jgi:hypothetical protein